MFHYNKQTMRKSDKQWMVFQDDSRAKRDTTSSAQSSAQSTSQFTTDFPRLGDLPILRDKSLVEELFSFDGPPDATVSVGGQDYYYFSGEGYLGLQANPEVLAATCEAVLRYGTSLGTVRRRFTPAPVFDVERQTSEIFGTEQAYYASGEMTVTEQLLGSIRETIESVFVDELVSDSTWSAVQRVFGNRNAVHTFRHRDIGHLSELIKDHLQPRTRPLVVTDGVFNVTGTIAPIPDYYKLLVEYPESALFIDDSEGLGVLGEKGRGTLEYYDYDPSGINRTQLDNQGDPTFGINSLDYWSNDKEEPTNGSNLLDPFADVFAPYSTTENTASQGRKRRNLIPPKKPLPVRTYQVASLSRAVGGFGTIISGSDRFIDRIKGTSSLYSEAIVPTPLATATLKGLQLSFHHDVIRHHLWDNVYYFKTEIEKLGIKCEGNMVPIVSIQTGTDGNMRRLQRELIKEQILVSFLQSMNQRRRGGSLRIALFATHERQMLDLLLDTLRRIL